MQKVLFFHNFLSCLLVQGITTMRKYDLVLSKAACEKTDYALKIFLYYKNSTTPLDCIFTVGAKWNLLNHTLKM